MLNHKLAPIEGYGRTASYNGLIGGAQLLRQGSNQRRLLILLTDGYDSEVKVAREAIVNYDLCRKIKVGLQSPLSVGSQQNTTVKLAIIGFDYVHQAEQGQILDYCVGADNVFNSSSFEEVENQILELIAEEVGTLS
jgi:tight adherence protein G